MAEYRNTTIRDLILENVGRNTFLPAIQREYVWNTSQIEKLFDSIMCEYPISSFLFWRIREENKKDWISYQFISDFDEENPHNIEANLDGVNQDIYLVLDGQQRITSLNIALRGTYRYMYHKWRKTKLYLNLLWKGEEDNPEEYKYQFLFKEDNKPEKRKNNPQLWYCVGDILNNSDPEDAKAAFEKQLDNCSDEEKLNARKMIGRLHNAIWTKKVINYYEEKTNDYDKVLEIFIRTNTGGQKLEYSDILLSTATAKWKNLNAREEINNFTDEINKISSGFNFGKDFVMKSAMYLTENLPIQYRLSSFTQNNLEKIEEHWDVTKQAISDSIKLICSYGIKDKNMVSRLPLLPIAQYLRNKNRVNYITSSTQKDVIDQTIIQKWFVIASLKGMFGKSSDNTLTKVRNAIGNESLSFPYMEINRELDFNGAFTSEIEIENLLRVKYSTRNSFLILSLLYPDRDWKDISYHEDHIFPQVEFSRKKLKERGYDDEKINQYQSVYDTILNLELLTSTENTQKKATPFEYWIVERDPNFKKRHSIPEMEDYSFDNFLEFIENRKKILIDRIKNYNF